MFIFILFSCSFCCFSFFKQVPRDMANSSGEEICGKGSPLQYHDEVPSSIADQLINPTCKILSCCDCFLSYWEEFCRFLTCFFQPTLTVLMDTVSLLLKECQKRIQVLTCALQRTALVLWRQLDLFMWKVGKHALSLIYHLFIMNSLHFASLLCSNTL